MAFNDGESNERHGGDPQESGETIALRHPVRREILRILHACRCERSSAMLADQLGIERSRVSYHLRALAANGCLIEREAPDVQGAIGRRFKSTVEHSVPVLASLSATKKADAETLRQERADKAGAGI